MRTFLLTCCLLAATACDEGGPTGPTVPLNERFTLGRGERAALGSTGIGLQFVGVTGDSRCPADVVCVQGGDAIVHVRVFDAGVSRSYELHTGDGQRATALHRNLRIDLLELRPYPFSSRVIDPSAYRVTLVVRG